MRVSEHFVIQEFIPRTIYHQFGSKSIWFLDPKIIVIAEALRVLLDKPLTVNNWHTFGQFSESGFRMPDTETGGKLSQHKFGRAIDFRVKDMTPDQVLEVIKDNWEALKELGLTTVEDTAFTKTWIHADCRQTNLPHLLVVKP